ncbi:MAG: cobalt-precorrin-5B (C(1))-methyltransferase [Geminicoccaceae bacterium]|nr:cobalt-precorrin-5B (C(1))-methyltransferase [Geminicoccaceae bacterium]
MPDPGRQPTAKGQKLRRGWTTGACATAAARAAFSALAGLDFPDPVTIRLPGGQEPSFALLRQERGPGWARASVVKDAGDDPDVTDRAEIVVTLRCRGDGLGLRFRAGEGVGTVTRAGLPLPPGEPAINPVPRRMMTETLEALAIATGHPLDLDLEIAIPGGAELAKRTLNPRLGIEGGLSILGTTGIVIPYSCSSWIHSIHRGVDVARAAGLDHIAACTGSTSECTVQALYDLPDMALIDMGDFAGGTLKYLRRRPIRRVTLAGGFAKLAKLAQGHLDLHSSRSTVDLADLAAELGALDPATGSAAEGAVSAGEVLALAGAHRPALARRIAERARLAAGEAAGPAVAIEALVVDRGGAILAHVPGW